MHDPEIGGSANHAGASMLSDTKDDAPVAVRSSKDNSASAVRALITLIEKHGSFAPVVVILGYVIGFVISNAHLARYQLVEFELLEGRYLAAAVLFTVFTVPPLLFGYVLAASISEPRSESPAAKKRSQFKAVLGHLFGYMLLSLVVFAAFQFVGMIFTFVSVRTSSNSHDIFVFYWLLAMVIAFVPKFLIWYSTADGSFRLEAGRVLALPIQSFFMLMATALFGQSVYPEISAAFGGGGAWLTNVEYAAGEGDSRIRMSNIVVLDRDSELLTLLPCYPEAERKPNSLLIPVADVKRIEMLREVTVSECQSSRSKR